jgi:hypothetical protein
MPCGKMDSIKINGSVIPNATWQTIPTADDFGNEESKCEEGEEG